MTSPTPSQHYQPMTAHSPTPWSVSNEEAIKIKDTRGDSLLSMYHAHLRGRRPANEVEANAAFIVDAVNSHASLKARIAELETAMKGATVIANISGSRIAELEGALDKVMQRANEGLGDISSLQETIHAMHAIARETRGRLA